MPSGNKTNHKRKRSNPWKVVDVQLQEGDEIEGNHYDNNNKKLNDRDLPAAPGEGVGLFYGLQVLDGSQYRVEGEGDSRVLIVRDDDGDDDSVKETAGVSGQTTKQSNKKDRATDKESTGSKSPAEGEGQPVEASEPAKKKRKKKKKKAKKDPPSNNEKTQASNESSKARTQSEEPTPEQIQSLQSAWASTGVTLHDDLCRTMIRHHFWTPLPIQAATLAPAILGRRNLVGAAPTGSGKTLAFLLPILQHLLEQQQQTSSDDNDTRLPLQALILAPTRELALQIQHQAELLLPRCSGTVVGGLAHAKQRRILQQNRPPLVVATPGRLWEMVR